MKQIYTDKTNKANKVKRIDSQLFDDFNTGNRFTDRLPPITESNTSPIGNVSEFLRYL